VKLYNQAKRGLTQATENSYKKVKRNKGFGLSVVAGSFLMMGLVRLTDITKKDVLGPWMTSISIAFVAQAARRKGAIEVFETPRIQQLAKQADPTRKDLIILKEIGAFCKKEAINNPKKMTSEKRAMSHDLGVVLEGQSVSGENFRIAGESKTSHANISTLALSGVDIPIVYGSKETKNDINALKNSRHETETLEDLLTPDKLVLEPYKSPDKKKVNALLRDIANHLTTRNANKQERMKNVYQRSKPTAYEVYQRQEAKNKPDKRLQLEEAKAHYTQVTDCDLAGGNLKQADFTEGLMILNNLELAQMERLKAPRSEWLRTSLVDADMRGVQAPHSRFYGMNLDYANLGVYFEDGIQKEDQVFQPTDLTHSRLEPFDYNRRDKIYVKSINTMNGANLQGAQLQHSDWSGVTAFGADFSSPVYPAEKIDDPELKKLLRTPPLWKRNAEHKTDLSHMKLRKCDFTGSNFTGAKLEGLKVPFFYKTLPDVGKHQGRKARTTPLVPLEYIRELRPVAFPNPAVVLEGANLSKTTWKETCLNRAKIKQDILPSFIFKNANVSEADFSEARFFHPFTKQRLTMPEVVEQATQQPPLPGQEELKQALKDTFTEAGHLKDKPPVFVRGNDIANESFVKNVLQIKPKEFNDAN
jgi:uncharacterized protein YjbI with pentapeptide repeats